MTFNPRSRILLVLGVFLLGLPSCTVATAAPQARADDHAAAVASSTAPTTPVASVLLYADLGEATNSCGCGKIIRMVRQARDRGVAVRELSTDKSDDAVKRYRLMVAPAVLLLDSKGEPITRYEGESAATVTALAADLDRLSKQEKR